MTLLIAISAQKQGRPRVRTFQRNALAVGVRRDLTMALLKRERWTESEIAALPVGEHDYFERKGEGFLSSTDFRQNLEKAVSAFANSGGGHLVIGVADNGQFEGVDLMRGRTSTREWLEQIISGSVRPPLADFRVHEVVCSSDSISTTDRVILVVDFGDSALTPHQAESQRVYFYRQAGRSERAPHFFLEAIRNRLLGPKLRPVLRNFRLNR